ncbi:uncharacterized protein [Phaseolus vulgaris]|uniref:uncharacterized protein n=1 Tax=Phaseolus vulgaris TaxID=3885 RepID=UPI0035CB0CE0
MGAFLTIALEWRAQAKNAAFDAQSLQALKQEATTLKEEKETWGRQEEAYKASLKLAQEAKDEADKQLLEAEEIQAELYVAKASEELQKELEDQCSDPEQKLEKMEDELAAKVEAFDLLQVEHDKLQTEVNRLQVEKEALEKQLASEDFTIEELEKAKKELIDDMADTFEEGFKDALAQAACENPEINISNCDSGSHIVDGKVVPLDLGK